MADKREPQAVRGVRPVVSVEPTTVLKTHSAFKPDNQLHPALRLKTAGFVYVMRNPLDMLLSYINFTRQQYERRKESIDYQTQLFVDLLGFDKPYSFEHWQTMKLEDIPRANLDHALTRFTELSTEIPGLTGVAGGSWLEHCRSWKHASEHLPAVFLKYEELLKGPESFLRLSRLFTFAEQQIVDAVNKVNETQQQRKGKKIFFNKMTAYYFNQFFSPEVVDRFLERFEAELTELGYKSLYKHRA
jgi:hypothetical protein